MKEPLYHKIGETVTINNEKYVVTECEDIYDCEPCDLQDKCCLGLYFNSVGVCTKSTRPDKKGVIYKRVE